MMRSLTMSLAALLAKGAVGKRHWAIDGFPNPNLEPRRCGFHEDRETAHTICDPDFILSGSDRWAIEERSDLLRRRKYDHLEGGGLECAVVVVKKMAVEGDDSDRIQEAAAAMAKGLHDTWGVGGVISGNGALIFVSVDDRVAYLSTGPSLRRLVTDGRAGRIIGEMKPALRKENYAEALLSALDGLARFTAAGPPSLDEVFLDALWPICFFAFFFAIVAFAIAQDRRLRSRRAEFDRVKARLEAIDRLRDRAERTGAAIPDSCPICLENFTMNEATPPLPDRGSDGKPVRALRCGHCFDETCLLHWVEQRTDPSCPICRKPVIDDGPLYSRAALTGSTGGAAFGATQDAEVRFRLQNLSRLHPRFIRPHHLNSWCSHRGPLARDPSFMALEPRIPTPTVENPATSRSFGGGHSSGGAGGRW